MKASATALVLAMLVMPAQAQTTDPTITFEVHEGQAILDLTGPNGTRIERVAEGQAYTQRMPDGVYTATMTNPHLVKAFVTLGLENSDVYAQWIPAGATQACVFQLEDGQPTDAGYCTRI